MTPFIKRDLTGHKPFLTYAFREEMVLSRITRRAIAQRGLMATATRSATDRKSDSFVFGMMQGTVNPENIFPYPSTLDEESLENLEAMIDPFQSVIF